MVGEGRALDVFPLVEERQCRHGVVAEGAVVIQGSFPVECDVVVALHRPAGHGVGCVFVDQFAGCGVNPRIAVACVVPVPVDVEGGIGVGRRLRDAGVVGAQRDVGFHREPLGDEVELLLEVDVGIELVVRGLFELARRERRTDVPEVGCARTRQTASRGVGIVRVGNLFQHPVGVIGRIHHRRSRIHHVEHARYGLVRRRVLDSQHTAHLDRQFRAACHVEIEVRTVVDAVVAEIGVAPLREILEDRPLVGISQREEVFDALRTARDVVVGVDGLGALAHGDVEPVVVRIADRIDARRRMGILLDLRTGNHRTVALGVFQRHVEQFGRLRRADVVGDHRREVHAVGERDVHLGLARGARAGGYDDDAVGAFGAEHGGRRSVFEHRQRGDLVGVDVRETALHAVNEH